MTDTAKSKTAEIETLSLALLGATKMDEAQLAASLTWQKGEDVLIGREAVLAAIKRTPKASIKIEEITAHGRAASVSGRLVTDRGARLFCQMIKFASASSQKVTSIVSFEHELEKDGR